MGFQYKNIFYKPNNSVVSVELGMLINLHHLSLKTFILLSFRDTITIITLAYSVPKKIQLFIVTVTFQFHPQIHRLVEVSMNNRNYRNRHGTIRD